MSEVTEMGLTAQEARALAEYLGFLRLRRGSQS